MTRKELNERFLSRTPSNTLPFVLDDEVRVLHGDYADRVGSVVVLDWARSPIQFLVEFGDGTDVLLPASSLELVRRDAERGVAAEEARWADMFSHGGAVAPTTSIVAGQRPPRS